MSEPPELAQSLLNPACYPGRPENVKLIRTFTSCIFLTGDYAYKVKKPVAPGYLDFTTLEKRRFYCNREVILNRRLCPDIYMDTVSITEEQNGLSVEGRGKAIEYAVKMRQMPGKDMLDALLDAGTVPETAMDGIARKISGFHTGAATNDTINDYGDLEFILTATEDNFLNSIRYIGKTISQKSYRHIKNYTNTFMEQNTALFYERIADGKIRDCHGDIRAHHICVNSNIYIFDCIEYNDSLRYCDVASDIALLAVNLDCYGRSDLSRKLIDSYITASGDEDLLQVLGFYKCYRAFDIGRTESSRLDTPGITADEKEEITTAAGRYFELAESYI